MTSMTSNSQAHHALTEIKETDTEKKVYSLSDDDDGASQADGQTDGQEEGFVHIFFLHCFVYFLLLSTAYCGQLD